MVKRYQNPRQTIIFVATAVSLMLFVELFLMGGFRDLEKARALPREVYKTLPDKELLTESEIKDYESAKQILRQAQSQAAAFKGPLESKAELLREIEPAAASGNLASLKMVPVQSSDLVSLSPHGLKEKAHFTPPSRNFKQPPKFPRTRPDKIAVIIDDMGMDMRHTREVIAIKAPLTLAFLPYAPQLPKISGEARQQGHELIIHVPMEPLNPNMNPGPLALRSSTTRTEFDLALDQIFSSFEGYVGINNHMGSKLTQDSEKMAWVMQRLAERNLIFVDSKTIASSVALNEAQAYGLKSADRDVFLDHFEDKELVLESLRHLEDVAHKRGYAVAIGHPKTATIEALQEWIPTLRARGFELVPISALARASDPLVMTYGPFSSAPVMEVQPQETLLPRQ